ncbi:hypothetical protein MUN46_008100 [Mesosutterella sp. AGMB02718]|uniref:Uncharacterized protein n=1 Tax=Mesosutterella faecium TaxID=2925194 RepID=A0ABT7IND3_9BURK|nr:hypothetical protein [Mesosutterella sp. AGMB02718]MDL2059889.1 hypothetical protein [Mesosutterella sp. AGMB02718]
MPGEINWPEGFGPQCPDNFGSAEAAAEGAGAGQVFGLPLEAALWPE